MEVISNTLTPIVPFIFLADPPSHLKLVSGDITFFNTLGNQEYDFTAIVNYSLLIRDDLSNSFSLAEFSISI